LSVNVRARRGQVRRLVTAVAELHQVAHLVAGRELDQAQAVARQVETHSLGVHGERVAEVQAGRQVVLVKVDLQGTSGASPGVRKRRPGR
jgi:hypothetical protein